MAREYKRQRGFFTIAQYSDKFGDYPRMAYALALSLKASQTEAPYLAVGMTQEDQERLPQKYKDAFDEVVTIPWTDEAIMHNWKLHNWWKAYHMTPYKETICLDADMIFTHDHSEWWPVLARRFPLQMCNSPVTFKGHIADTSYYSKQFQLNKLYRGYAALTYFRQSKEARKFFNMCEDIFKNWDQYSWEYIRHNKVRWPATDEVYGLAIRLLEWEEKVKPFPSFTFVHLKSKCQGLLDHRVQDIDWPEYLLDSWDDHGRCFINNYLQTKPLHYHVKKWLTDDHIKRLERLVA